MKWVSRPKMKQTDGGKGWMQEVHGNETTM
jgi:hypothetical protein